MSSLTDSTAFKVLQIDHVELFVPDRYEAARWYGRVLGLQVVPECEPWAAGGGPLMISSDAGSTKLALFEGQPVAAPQTAAFRRVAFRVTGKGFAEFLQRLQELALVDGHQRPVTRASIVDHQQAYSIYFSDPYGHQLEVTTYDYLETSAHLSDTSS
jgi:catechol 2,3-dioxygenase-like lactoylglutathione lyase family enzyme